MHDPIRPTSALHREPIRLSGTVRVLLLAAVAVAFVGCQGASDLGSWTPWSSGGAADMQPLGSVGTWYEGALDCAAGECESAHPLLVGESGKLRAQVFVPYGSDGLPEFEVVLIDADGNEIARPSKPTQLPRTIDAALGPGEYRVVVRSGNESDGRFSYKLVATLVPEDPDDSIAAGSGGQRDEGGDAGDHEQPPVDDGTGTDTVDGAGREGEDGGQEPPPPPPPDGEKKRPVVATLDILGPEERGDDYYVVLDPDRAAGVEPGMRAELKYEGRQIGECVIVALYPEGIECRVTGELEGESISSAVAEILR